MEIIEQNVDEKRIYTEDEVRKVTNVLKRIIENNSVSVNDYLGVKEIVGNRFTVNMFTKHRSRMGMRLLLEKLNDVASYAIGNKVDEKEFDRKHIPIFLLSYITDIRNTIPKPINLDSDFTFMDSDGCTYNGLDISVGEFFRILTNTPDLEMYDFDYDMCGVSIGKNIKKHNIITARSFLTFINSVVLGNFNLAIERIQRAIDEEKLFDVETDIITELNDRFEGIDNSNLYRLLYAAEEVFVNEKE